MAAGTQSRAVSGMVGKNLKPRSAEEEVWEITIPGTVALHVTTYTRTGQPVTQDISVGPNRQGHQIRLSVEDREYNQGLCADVSLDPFRNGILVRVDGDQQQIEETVSASALTTQQLVAIFEKHGNAFHAAVDALEEIPLRRLREMADAVDATAKQVDYIDEVIDERFRRGYAQPDVVLGLDGQVRKAGTPGASARGGDDETS